MINFRNSLLTCIGASLLFATSCSKEDEDVNTINIQNEVLKTALLENTALNTNGNNEIEASEASAFTGNFICINCGLTEINILESFPNITRLSLYDNNISSIDLSKNLKIEQLLLEKNELTTLDVSMLTSLTDLKVHTNSLTSLNVANGNNQNFTRMQAQGNYELGCIQVDDLEYPNNDWLKELSTVYATDCSY